MYVVYDVFRKDLLQKKIDFKKDGIMVALMREGFRLNPADFIWDDVCDKEIKGEGYKSGGQLLRNVGLAKKPWEICIYGDNPIWESARFSAGYIMLYFARTKKLIGCIKFPWRVTKANGGLFTVQWESAGILVEDNPDAPPQYLKYYLEKENTDA